MLQVKQIFDDSKQRYGAEKIRVVLAENGIRVGKERIRKIMNELGLVSIRENAKSNYKKCQQYQKRNLLNQEFKAKRQNETWVSDITYFKIKSYAVYLWVIIDLFPRRVVGWRVSRKSSTYLVTATFRQAFEDRGRPGGLTFHSDRGGQYISDTFMSLLRSYGVKQSFSNSGRPMTMRWLRLSFPHSKRRKPTAETISRRQTSEKAWTNTSASIMRSDPTRP